MAVFNKREVGYIKAIAGVGKHKSFIHKRKDVQLNSAGLELTATNSRLNVSAKKCTVYALPLAQPPIAVDATEQSGDISTWNAHCGKLIDGKFPGLGMLQCPMVVEGKEDVNGTTAAPHFTTTEQRVGTEFFLDKSFVRLRFTMPDFQITSGQQPHYEYRLIIFRGRKPQASCLDGNTQDPTTTIHGASYLNYWYDLFNGYVGRPVGFVGWRQRQDFDGAEYYKGCVSTGGTNFTTTGAVTPFHPPGESQITADDLMTMPLNDADYVIKSDERFFLGPEHGKSHFEKNISFDWNQRGDTASDDLAQGLDPSFNPLWTMLLIATSNDTAIPKLNILVRATTSIESA